jgi:hypothetical protein
MKKDTMYIIGYFAIIGISLYFLQVYKNKQRELVYQNPVTEDEALDNLNNLK